MTPRPLQRDAVFSVLGHRVRRALVDVAPTIDAPISLSHAADAVAKGLFEQVQAPTAETAALTNRLEIRLHHVHLPKLDSAGVLTYRPETQTVTAFDSDAVDQLSTASDALFDAGGIDTLTAD